jgi:hypothetical protein
MDSPSWKKPAFECDLFRVRTPSVSVKNDGSLRPALGASGAGGDLNASREGFPGDFLARNAPEIRGLTKRYFYITIKYRRTRFLLPPNTPLHMQYSSLPGLRS